MPKVNGTRQQRAQELLDLLERGPHFSESDFQSPWNENRPNAIASEKYKLWVRSWVIDQFKDLVPELKKKS